MGSQKRKGIFSRIYNRFYSLRLFLRTVLLLAIFFAITWGVAEITKDGMMSSLAIFGGIFVMACVTVHYTYQRLGWERKKEITSDINELMAQSPYEFEHTVANLMQKMGYSAKVTAKSDGEEGGDYGADIIAERDGRRIVVQVKKWASHNLVGNQDVRSVLGCLHTFKASKAILVTTSDFTEQAYEQAKGGPIELWNGVELSKLMAKYA